MLPDECESGVNGFRGFSGGGDAQSDPGQLGGLYGFATGVTKYEVILKTIEALNLRETTVAACISDEIADRVVGHSSCA